MASLIQSLFTVLDHAHVLQLLPLEVLNTSQPCPAPGTACSRAQLMLHCFSLTSGILNSFTLPIQVGSNTSIHSFSPCFLFVVLKMILFIYNELLHLLCQDFKIQTGFLAVLFHYLRICLFNFNIESDYFQYFSCLTADGWLCFLVLFLHTNSFSSGADAINLDNHWG